MDVPAILKIIGEQIHACASGKLAFAEPISIADRTVIPVAWVRYDFGAGGDAPAVYRRMSNEAGGGGGGGQVSVVPTGFVEITPTGTHFIPIPDAQKILALVAASFGTAGMNGAGSHGGDKTLPVIKNKRAGQTTGQKETGKKASKRTFGFAVKEQSVRSAVPIRASRPVSKKSAKKTDGPPKSAAAKKAAPERTQQRAGTRR